MKICCDRCEKVIRKTVRTPEVTIEEGIIACSKYYLCNDCVIKLREFLKYKESGTE